MSQHTNLARQVAHVCLLNGSFKLRSGVTATEYFDKYRFESNPILLREIVEHLALLLPTQFDALAGLELGGIPIATILSQITGKPLLFIRKQAKDYGTCRFAEGGEVRGRRLLIVEDVVTSGGAILDAVRALRTEGAIIENVVCVIDRESGGRENLQKEGLSLAHLFTKHELDSAAKDWPTPTRRSAPSSRDFSVSGADREGDRSLAFSQSLPHLPATVSVRSVAFTDSENWRILREQLWPNNNDRHAADIAAFFAGTSREPATVLVAEKANGTLVGFVELSIRRDYVEGAARSPVAYLEGWFVVDAERGQGIGSTLIAHAEQWAAAQGLRELASDAPLDNETSRRAHLASAFQVTSTLVHYIKSVSSTSGKE